VPGNIFEPNLFCTKRFLDAYTARRTILTASLILHSRPDTITTIDANTEDGEQAGLSLAVCCGFLAKHMGIIRSLALVELLTAAGIVVVVIAPPMAAFSPLPVLGPFLQGSSSITYGTIRDMFHPNRQARGFSLIYTTANISSVTASITLGLISDQFGLSVMMLTMAALTLATLPLCALLLAETARPIVFDR
jgi:MFS family permease